MLQNPTDVTHITTVLLINIFDESVYI